MMNTRSGRLHIKTFLLCLPVILALSCSQALAQQSPAPWAITFGGGLAEDSEARVTRTADGGSLVTYSTESFSESHLAELIVTKLTASGSVQWRKIYRHATYGVFIFSVKQTTDDGYILAGALVHNSSDTYSYILKLNSSGSIQWDRSFALSLQEPYTKANNWFRTVAQVVDGGYVAAGGIEFSTNAASAYVVKFAAADGDVSWYKVCDRLDEQNGSVFSDAFADIIQTTDGGFMALGESIANGTNLEEIFVVKGGGDGATQWQKLYETMDTAMFHNSIRRSSFEPTSDSGFVVAGSICFGGPSCETWDGLLLKVDSSHAVTWSMRYGHPNGSYLADVKQTADGGYAAVGVTSSLPAFNDPEGWLFKVSSSGGISWQKTYFGKGLAYDNLESLDLTASGYVVTGLTASFSESGSVWVLNLDTDGAIPDCDIIGPGYAVASAVPFIASDINILESQPGFSLTTAQQVVASDITIENFDVCSLKIDSDQDGIEDGVDNCPDKPNFEQQDLDSDGIGDVCDPDADDDTYYKIGEYYPGGQPGDDCNDLDDTVYPGQGCLELPEDEKPSSSNSSVDADGDGVANTIDNCASIKNADQKDTDGDKIGDLCDLCPNDALNDADHDGVCGNVDNCPSHYNPLTTWIDINSIPHTGQQPNFDLDQQGDACDQDADNDGYAKAVDCNDLDPDVNPGKVEIAYNNKDDDCNPETPDKGILFSLTSNMQCEGGVASCTLENWLPRDGETITVTASIGGGYSGTVTSLLCSNASAYPGKYSNDIDTTATPDFDCTVKSASKVELASHDYGGKIQITATATVDGNTVVETLVLPRDTDLDGLPDYWEKRYGNLAANENLDKDPDGVNQFYGDGLTAFEEYRGFKWGRLAVSTDGKYNTPAFVPIDEIAAVHFRTDPTRKDLFVKFIDYDPDHPFAVGAAFVNAQLDVHAIDADLVSLLSDPVWEGKHVVTVTHTLAFYPLTDGRINKRSVRNWEPDTKGWSGVGTETSYGADTKTYNPSFVGYFYDKPYQSGQTWTGSQWTSPNSLLDPYNMVEDVNDNAVLDLKEDWTPTNKALDGDKLVSLYVWNNNLSALDIDNDGLVELPLTTVPYQPGSNYEYTLAQSLKHTLTHEIGHAIGMTHSTDPNCVMYEVSTDWTRDGFFCNAARAQSQMH